MQYHHKGTQLCGQHDSLPPLAVLLILWAPETGQGTSGCAPHPSTQSNKGVLQVSGGPVRKSWEA